MDNPQPPITEMTEDELRRAYALLEQRLADQTRELATLLSVQQAISSRLNRQEVLQMIADGARQLTSSQFCGVYLLENGAMRLAVLSMQEDGRPVNIGAGYSIPLDQSIGRIALQTGKSILISDVRSDPRAYKDVVERTGIRSFVIVPLLSGKRPLGLLIAVDKLTGPLTTDDERILNALASSAVIGLENARLYEQAEENAVMAERSRLARELHDAVTQTLFSASLIAEVLPRIWETDPEEGRRRLEELRLSTRGALAEMRSLLLELRPTALLQAEPVELFKHLANAFIGRTRVPVNLHYEGSSPLPGEIKVSLYRIAQEALNNIAKYADATAVDLTLACLPDRVDLEIRDNGIGFEPGEPSSGHLGLRIMKERAGTIQADLSVQSTPGRGTTIAVCWRPKKDDEKS